MKISSALILPFIAILAFSSCANKQVALKTYSKNILFKSKKIKFYDTSFVTIYQDHIHLEVFNSANLVLTLKIFKDKICRDNFRCTSSKEFNKEYFGANYPTSFLYDIFLQQKASFKDKQRNIIIKIF